jgi:hypothetical protein
LDFPALPLTGFDRSDFLLRRPICCPEPSVRETIVRAAAAPSKLGRAHMIPGFGGCSATMRMHEHPKRQRRSRSDPPAGILLGRTGADHGITARSLPSPIQR